MKVIDFHTHIFPDNLAGRAIAALLENAPGVAAKTNGTLSGLRASMKKNNVMQSVLLPIATKLSQVSTINKTCKALMSDDCIPFGTLHPDMETFLEEIDLLKSLHVKGIKLHPEYQNFFIDTPRIFPIYEALQAEGMIVVFHAGKDPGPFTCDHALPPAFKKIHANFPRLKISAAHMGGWQVWQDVEKYSIDLPVYFDTAAVREFLPVPEFIRLARKHGTDRILFGSDSPWYDQGEDIAWIESMPLTPEEKERILFKNAESLLNSGS
jgi:predicted TIM-barrel fold metal-dependent hydrolase